MPHRHHILDAFRRHPAPLMTDTDGEYEPYSPADDDVFPTIPQSYLQKEYICRFYPYSDQTTLDVGRHSNAKAGIALYAHPNGVAFIALHTSHPVLNKDLTVVDQAVEKEKENCGPEWFLDFDVDGTNLTQPISKKGRARGPLLTANQTICVIRSPSTCYDLICPVNATLLEINQGALDAKGEDLLRWELLFSSMKEKEMNDLSSCNPQS